MRLLAATLLAAGLAGVPVQIAQTNERAEKSMEDSEIARLLQEVDQSDETTGMSLLSRADEQRHQLLGALVKELDTSSSKKVHIAAVYLIGAHRLDRGVWELIKWIDLDAGERRKQTKEALWDRYPSMEALIRIGKPSVRPAMDLLSREDDALRRYLAVKVIRYVEGADIAELILSRAESSESDTHIKRRWTDALARLHKLPR
jgi:hypothetical protein